MRAVTIKDIQVITTQPTGLRLIDELPHNSSRQP